MVCYYIETSFIDQNMVLTINGTMYQYQISITGAWYYYVPFDTQVITLDSVVVAVNEKAISCISTVY